MYFPDDMNSTVSGVMMEDLLGNTVIPLPVSPQLEPDWRIQDDIDIDILIFSDPKSSSVRILLGMYMWESGMNQIRQVD